MSPDPQRQPPASMKYRARIVEVGPLVSDLMAAGVLILFGTQAPPELREIALVHDGTTLSAPIEPDDWLHIGPHTYHITAVGSLANKNLEELGHIVIKANGAAETELPGECSVAPTDLHIPALGDEVVITRRENYGTS